MINKEILKNQINELIVNYPQSQRILENIVNYAMEEAHNPKMTYGKFLKEFNISNPFKAKEV